MEAAKRIYKGNERRKSSLGNGLKQRTPHPPGPGKLGSAQMPYPELLRQLREISVETPDNKTMPLEEFLMKQRNSPTNVAQNFRISSL